MGFQKSYAIPAKPAPVFDALTSERHLRVWFAEQVAVGAQPGDPFRFWGRHTLWVPKADDAAQTLTRLEFPRALGFAWTWRSSPTEVTLEVVPDAEGTRVDLHHELPQPWPASDPDLGAARAEDPERILEAFWGVAMHNLAFYLHQGDPCLLPSYAEAGSQQGDTLRLSLLIEAPAAEIYRALVEPRLLNQADDRGPRRIVALDPGERIVHDWCWPDEPTTLVTWELAANDDETTVTLAHAGLAARNPLYALGWCHTLLALRATVTGG